MAEAEAVKLVLNGGSFGLMAIFVVWVLFRASPALQSSIEKMNADHDATVKAMAADYRTSLTATADAHKTAIATLAAEFRASLAEMHRECRAERAELLLRHDAALADDRSAQRDHIDKVADALNALTAQVIRNARGTA